MRSVRRGLKPNLKTSFTYERNSLLSVFLLAFSFSILFTSPRHAQAQSCDTAGDLDEATRSAITAAGRRYFDMVAQGDAASLRQNLAPSVVADFSAIETAVQDHKKDLADAKATVKSVFLLEVTGSAPLQHGEFYCGVFGKNGQTANSAVFELNNLQPGKYAVVILGAVSPKSQSSVSVILELAASAWKLGGLYIRPTSEGGHDSEWFVARAREFQSKSEMHNAWFYYVEARELASPLDFMSTAVTDKLYDESHGVQPTDVPANGKTVDLVAGAATYHVTALFPQVVGDELDLVVRYQVADASNTAQSYQSNLAVMKALIEKFPEVKNAFGGVVARAVDPSGHDYGTLLAMKDIK
jgi:hypothetical protein